MIKLCCLDNDVTNEAGIENNSSNEKMDVKRLLISSSDDFLEQDLLQEHGPKITPTKSDDSITRGIIGNVTQTTSDSSAGSYIINETNQNDFTDRFLETLERKEFEEILIANGITPKKKEEEDSLTS